MRILYYLITFGLVCFAWALIEGQLFRVKRIELTGEKIDSKMKIVFISDIHYGYYYYKNRLESIVKKINQLEPDLILIGGDYLDFGRASKLNKKAMKQLFEELAQLKSKYGNFTVLGNHDYYLKENMKYMIEEIKKSNITLLVDRSYQLNVKGNKIIIHGVSDLQEGQLQVSKLKPEKDALNIMISHNPDFYEQFHAEFDIAFSGHLHGGQVNFFGIYAPQTESKYGQKYIKTINKKGAATIVTTKGLGCSSLPIRFFALPEIILAQIDKKG